MNWKHFFKPTPLKVGITILLFFFILGSSEYYGPVLGQGGTYYKESYYGIQGTLSLILGTILGWPRILYGITGLPSYGYPLLIQYTLTILNLYIIATILTYIAKSKVFVKSTKWQIILPTIILIISVISVGIDYLLSLGGDVYFSSPLTIILFILSYPAIFFSSLLHFNTTIQFISLFMFFWLWWYIVVSLVIWYRKNIFSK